MPHPTGEEVQQAYADDPHADHANDRWLRVMWPYIGELPNMLAQLLDQRITFTRLVWAKVVFYRHCLALGIVDRAYETFLDSEHSVVEQFERELRNTSSRLEQINPAPRRFLSERGLREREVILGDWAGFSEEVAALYLAGTLTIGELLVRQPSAITNFRDLE